MNIIPPPPPKIIANDVLSIAKQFVADGLSVIPIVTDASKPGSKHQWKQPLHSGWRKYSTVLPTPEELQSWFGNGAFVGIGVVPGPASGNLVVLDFEHHEQSAYFEWIQRLPEDLRVLAQSLPTVATPTGGRHIYIRLPEAQPGAKLARYAAGKTKIEVRGEGHQVLAPGCPAECHPTGKLYEWLIHTPVVQISLDQWGALLEWCAACNEYQAAEQPRDRDASIPGTPAGEDSPGNDFNRRGTWEETGLFEAGWTWQRKVGDDKGFLTRPGKDTGISASVGMVSSKAHGYPYFYAWSTSTDFTAEVPFSRFAVYSQLKHAGNYSEAAKQLAREGYGERPGMKVKLSVTTVANGIPAPPRLDEDSRWPFKWMSELSAQADDTKWIWKGYIPRGGIVLLSALFKAGKSTLLSHLLKSFGGSMADFLGLEVAPSRVLYITEEDESIWAGRRDTLMIGDYVGMCVRPFKMRPTMQEWREFIQFVEAKVKQQHFDLVVFDTLSKMWPVREENDAGQVEEALMPLWTISSGGTSILLVHHMRKSEGQQFVGARGSGGLPAFAELLMEFRRSSDDQKDPKRIINAVGRYTDTPSKLLIELQAGKYVSLGDPDDSEVRVSIGDADGWKADLAAVFESTSPTWLKLSEIRELLASRREGKAVREVDMVAALTKWTDEGELERTGDGKKGRPHLWRHPITEPGDLEFTSQESPSGPSRKQEEHSGGVSA